MDLYTLTKDFIPQRIIGEFVSAIWTERYSSAGDVQIVTPATPAWIKKLAPGTFVGLRGTKEIMLLDTKSIENNLLTVSGPSLPKFLDEREAWFPNPDDTGNLFAEYTTDTLTAGELISSAVEKTAANPVVFPPVYININLDWARDKIPGLQLGAVDANGDPKRLSVRIGPLYTSIQQLAEQEGVGIKLYLASSTFSTGYVLKFATYRGKDRTSQQTANQLVRLTPKMDSLTDVKELESLSNYKNVIYVYYHNEVTKHYAEPTLPIPEGFSRRVLMVEAEDIYLDGDHIAAYREQTARNAIANNNYVMSVDGQVSPQIDYKFNVDYGLGDIIELEGLTGLLSKARVTEYIRSQDQNGEREYPTLSVIDPINGDFMPDTEPDPDHDTDFDGDPDYDFDIETDTDFDEPYEPDDTFKNEFDPNDDDDPDHPDPDHPDPNPDPKPVFRPKPEDPPPPGDLVPNLASAELVRSEPWSESPPGTPDPAPPTVGGMYLLIHQSYSDADWRDTGGMYSAFTVSPEGQLLPQVPGGAVVGDGISYDATAHRWLGLRAGEISGGEQKLEYLVSPDGTTWTKQFETTMPVDLYDVYGTVVQGQAQVYTMRHGTKHVLPENPDSRRLESSGDFMVGKTPEDAPYTLTGSEPLRWYANYISYDPNFLAPTDGIPNLTYGEFSREEGSGFEFAVYKLGSTSGTIVYNASIKLYKVGSYSDPSVTDEVIIGTVNFEDRAPTRDELTKYDPEFHRWMGFHSAPTSDPDMRELQFLVSKEGNAWFVLDSCLMKTTDFYKYAFQVVPQPTAPGTVYTIHTFRQGTASIHGAINLLPEDPSNPYLFASLGQLDGKTSADAPFTFNGAYVDYGSTL
jgi:hypothetical protein